MTKNLEIFLDSFFVRIINIFAMFALLIATVNTRQLDIFAALLASASLFIVQEVRIYYRLSRNDTYTSADRATFERFIEIFPGNTTIDFLKQFTFRNYYRNESFVDMRRFQFEYCKRPENSFLDPELEEKRINLERACEDLTGEMGIKTFPHINDLFGVPKDWRDGTVKTLVEVDYDALTEKYYRFADLLDERAKTVITAYEDLFHTARTKLYKDE